jgi:GAF domain-containing protein
MDDRTIGTDLNARATEVLAHAGMVHQRSALLLRRSGKERAAREAERLAAGVRDALLHRAAMARMYGLASRFRHASQPHQRLDEALEGAVALLHADFGTIQLRSPRDGVLRIAVQHGFAHALLEGFTAVAGDESAGGRAAAEHTQVVLEDVVRDPAFGPRRAIAAAAGFRAVQSTPLIDRGGRLHGVLSTHWRRPHRPAEHELRLMLTYGRLLADALAGAIDPGPRRVA